MLVIQNHVVGRYENAIEATAVFEIQRQGDNVRNIHRRPTSSSKGKIYWSLFSVTASVTWQNNCL